MLPCLTTKMYLFIGVMFLAWVGKMSRTTHCSIPNTGQNFHGTQASSLDLMADPDPRDLHAQVLVYYQVQGSSTNSHQFLKLSDVQFGNYMMKLCYFFNLCVDTCVSVCSLRCMLLARQYMAAEQRRTIKKWINSSLMFYTYTCPPFQIKRSGEAWI